MKKPVYLTAAIFAIIAAVLFGPFIIFAIYSEFQEDDFYTKLSTILICLYSLVDIFLLWALKKAANEELHSTSLNIPVYILIIMNVVSAFLYIYTGIESTNDWISVLELVIVGAMFIYLGVAIHSAKLEALKIYGTLKIVSGALYCSVILFFVAPIIDIIAYIMLSILFFKIYNDKLS